MKSINIANGINLISQQDDKFKTNFLSVNFLIPLKEKDASFNSLLHNVLKKGCAAYPDIKSINMRLEELYGASFNSNIKKMGEAQILSFTIEFIKNEFSLGDDILKDCASFLKEIIFNPKLVNNAFDSVITSKEKKNLVDFINSQMNDKRSYAVSRCHELMCENETYGISEYGKISEVESITPSELYEHYIDLLKSSQILIFTKGNIDEKVITTLFSDSFKNRDCIVTLSNNVNCNIEKIREFTEKMPVNQGKLTLCFRTGVSASDNNFPVLSLFNCLYGGSPTSKLFENVREKLSLCYYCSSMLEKHKGLMTVYSGVEDKNKDTAYNEILAQLENIKNGDITENELEAARKALINTYKTIDDSFNMSLLYNLGQYLSGTNITPEEFTNSLQNVRKDEIISIAQSIKLDTVYFLSGDNIAQ